MDKELTKENIQIIEAHDDLEYKYGLEKYPKFGPNNINWIKPMYDWEPKPSTFKLPYYEALELADINANIGTGLSLIQNRINFLKAISSQSKDNNKPKEIDFICIQCLRFPIRAKICKKCGYFVCYILIHKKILTHVRNVEKDLNILMKRSILKKLRMVIIIMMNL